MKEERRGGEVRLSLAGYPMSKMPCRGLWTMTHLAKSSSERPHFVRPFLFQQPLRSSRLAILQPHETPRAVCIFTAVVEEELVA